MIAVITIDIDPVIQIGPGDIAWHGLTSAIRFVVGGALATKVARERELDVGEIMNLVGLIGLAGIVGARAYYQLENDAAAPVSPRRGPTRPGSPFTRAGCTACAWMRSTH